MGPDEPDFVSEEEAPACGLPVQEPGVFQAYHMPCIFILFSLASCTSLVPKISISFQCRLIKPKMQIYI